MGAMMGMNRLLKKHLKRAGMGDESRPPELSEWLSFLENVNRHYDQVADDRALLERSLEISTKEMEELHSQLAAEGTTMRSVLKALSDAVGRLTSAAREGSSELSNSIIESAKVELGNEIRRSLMTTRDSTSSVITSLQERFDLLVQEVSGLLASASDVARDEFEREVANAVSSLLMPKESVQEVGGLVVAGVTQAAELCGGDWWNVSSLRDGRVVVLVGDVTGHGLPAALLTATAKGSYDVACASMKHVSLDPLFKMMNIGILESARRKYFMTACGLLWDAHSGLMSYASAGHVSPILVRRDEARALPCTGAPLGLSSVHDVEVHETRLERGDRMVLFSDGITEARNADGEEFGDKRLRSLCLELLRQPPAVMRDEILATIGRFTGGSPREDDFTVVVLEVT